MIQKFLAKKKNLIFLYVYIYIYIFFLMSDLLIPSFLVSDVSKSLRFSPKMSKWVKRLFFWANHSFAHFWAKNEQFAQKTIWANLALPWGHTDAVQSWPIESSIFYILSHFSSLWIHKSTQTTDPSKLRIFVWLKYDMLSKKS